MLSTPGEVTLAENLIKEHPVSDSNVELPSAACSSAAGNPVPPSVRQAILHCWSQKRRRSAVIPSRCFPAYLARVQRVSRPRVKLPDAPLK